MGRYIQAGICNRIKVSKREMEQNRVNFEEFKEELAKGISLELYEVEELESAYIFSYTIIDYSQNMKFYDRKNVISFSMYN